MANISLEPYIFFKGNCKEAMEFYKNIFGGELEFTEADPDQWGDMPNKDWFKGKIMHCSLKGPVSFMASDGPKASPEMKKVSLSLSGTDETNMRKIFDTLAEGGTVQSPLKKEVWGDIFGILMDKYGVEWMMNIGQPQEEK